MNSEEVEVCTLPYVLVLHAFCVVDPTLCAPASDPSQFVVTLQPYLKSQVINLSFTISNRNKISDISIEGILIGYVRLQFVQLL